MVINPKVAVENMWIYPVMSSQIQPNGVDLRLNRVFQVGSGVFTIRKDDIKKSSFVNIELIPQEDFFFLKRGHAYIFEMVEKVCIPDNVCAMVFSRSTFNRNGIIIRSCLFDSGFKNIVGASVYPMTNLRIEKGSRVAQIVFFEAKSYNLYSGQYNEAT